MDKSHINKIKIFNRIPLINTSPDVDMGIIIGLLPIYWFVGIEQFIWPVLLLWVAIKIIIVKRSKVIIPNVLQLFLLFMVSQTVSGFTALSAESFDSWFAFLRNLAAFVTGFLVFFVIVNACHDWRQVKRLVITVAIVMGITAIFGILGIVGLLRFQYYSPVSSIFPSWLMESSVADRFSLRSLGINTSFFSIKYYRLTTFFSFPTLYATALLTALPFTFFAVKISGKKIQNFLFIILIALMGINLIFTTSRAATASLVAGFIYFQVIVKKRRKALKWSVAASAALILLIVVVLNTGLLDALNELVTVRSTDTRLRLYIVTLEYWLNRPLFGWGIARRMPETDIYLPLGSHSYYQAILFRFGLVGTFIFLSKYLVLWLETQPFNELNIKDSELLQMNDFLEYGRWIFVASLLDGFATIPISDISTTVIVWMGFGLLFITRKLFIKRKAQLQEQ